MKVYHPNQLNAEIRALLPTPAHFAQYALERQGYIFAGATDPNANPAEIWCAQTLAGLWGYEGDRIYVEDTPGLTILSDALLSVR
jgi:hypothetical protein